MDHFKQLNGIWHCESVSLETLAEQYGTPLYFYSFAILKNKCHQFVEAFRNHPTEIFYAVKANDNLCLLNKIFQMGLGADVVSLGELERSMRAGVSPSKVVFSGVGKTAEEISRAIQVGISAINVESLSELLLIQEISQKLQQKVSVNVRVNPNIDVKTNPYIATGLYETKFGVADEDLMEVLQPLIGHRWVQLEGLACHIGSQIADLKSFELAAERMVLLAEKVKQLGFPISRIDMGGGLAVAYKELEIPPTIESYAQTILSKIKPTGFKLCLEPGRAIIAEAGGLLTRVIHTKSNRKRHFTIVDAAMNNLLRPSLYEAHHEIVSVRSQSEKLITTDIVGPICETGDFLGLNRCLPEPKTGDLLWIKTAGAYGAAMSSHYNSRPRIAEVLVHGKDVQLIRQREPLSSLWQHELL